jgi:hypothetical protein
MTNRSGMKALLLMGVLAATPASAGTPRSPNFPSTVCLRSAEASGVPVYDENGISNYTTDQTLHIACPIAMSVGANHNLGMTSMVAAGGSMCETNSQPSVEFFDQNTAQDADCTLYLLDAGNVVVGSWGVSTSGSYNGRMARTFAMPRMDFTGRTLFINCKIPPRNSPGGEISSVVNFIVPSCDL